MLLVLSFISQVVFLYLCLFGWDNHDVKRDVGDPVNYEPLPPLMQFVRLICFEVEQYRWPFSAINKHKSSTMVNNFRFLHIT